MASVVVASLHQVGAVGLQRFQVRCRGHDQLEQQGRLLVEEQEQFVCLLWMGSLQVQQIAEVVPVL